MALTHQPDVTASPPTDDEDQKSPSNHTEYDTQLTEEKDTGDRKIGKWYIKETLGKGGYSWVKRGIDCDTGRVFALKFMERRKDKNGKLPKSQIKQVETEIDVLRRVGKCDNIIRLYAYNLKQEYPDRNQQRREVILLVLEYAPGGELFDLLYYTDTLEPILARTYFRQLCSGLECLHNKGIIHRDLKPQNLLLDEHYNLKITDFGLSKVINLKKVKDEQLKNAKLTNPRVGTKGYQAPELVMMNERLRNKQSIDGLYYTNSIDIFSMGVILFILMTGYPPFKSADPGDKWYSYLAQKQYESFWKAHRNSGLKKAETDLITRMLLADFNKRYSLEKIKNHSWFKEQILTNEQLEQVLIYRHQEMQLKRSMDDTKRAILQHSERVNLTARPILPNFKEKILARGYTLNQKAPTLPNNIKPNMIRDIYTTCDAYEVLQEIKLVIENDMRGILISSQVNEIFVDDENKDVKPEKGEIDIDNFCLTATIAHLKEEDGDNDDDEDDDGGLNMEFEGSKIHVRLYWDEKVEATLVQFNILQNKDIFDPKDDFWEKKKMVDMWKRLKNAFILKANAVLTGLPKEKKKVNKDIEALYNMCFPKKKEKKEPAAK